MRSYAFTIRSVHGLTRPGGRKKSSWFTTADELEQVEQVEQGRIVGQQHLVAVGAEKR
jgi:hypothetical protein